jgi:NAD(P)-dependent dehydrogenase (short-subunit alcohol dehydrogenase family)
LREKRFQSPAEFLVSGGDADARTAEKQIEHMVSMRRIGRSEEGAEAVLRLCSDAASYVTGHSMIVDGGFTAPVR